jgi:ABC-type transport system involved in multi-copper enzyme maturation permease subunit
VAGGALLICAVGVGMTVIRNDLDSGAIVAILAKPVSRLAYTAGKMTAGALLLLAVDGLFSLATIGLLAVNGGSHVGVLPSFFAVLAANAVIWMVPGDGADRPPEQCPCGLLYLALRRKQA